jgi:hypothetical protein
MDINLVTGIDFIGFRLFFRFIKEGGDSGTGFWGNGFKELSPVVAGDYLFRTYRG